MDVADKVVLITGAARGLGFEYARSLGAAGAYIVAGDVADCADAVAAAGSRAIGVRLDVTDIASADSMAELAMGKFGRIDALINNAALYGTLRGGRFNQIAEADWDATMAVNVKGIWHCCKAVVPAMRQSGGGSIINVASGWNTHAVWARPARWSSPATSPTAPRPSPRLAPTLSASRSM